VTSRLSAQHYGLDRPLVVEAASQARRFVATAAAGDASPIEPVSSVTAARSFVDDLFRSGRVDYRNLAARKHGLPMAGACELITL
jgi:hypothetical protein